MDQTTTPVFMAANDANAKRPSTGTSTSSSSHRPYPPPSSQTAASTSSLALPTDVGNKSLDRVRVSRSTSTTISSSASASSSSTSLPRSILHHPQSVRSGGVSGGIETPHQQQPRQGDVLSSVSVSVSEAGVIFGAEQARTSPRLRTLSESSSSGLGHGRVGGKKRPLTPGSATRASASASASAHPASWSAPHVPLPSNVSSRAPSTSAVENNTAISTPVRTHPRSPSSAAIGTRLVTPPGLASMVSSPSSSASNITPPPQRRPSLASPLPATPIIPSHLPKAAVRNPPAPLNLSAATSSTSLRQQHGYHTTTGSLSSPHGHTHTLSHMQGSSPLSSPSAAQQRHHTQRMNSAPTPPSSYASSGAPQGHHPSPSQSQSQASAQSQQNQGWATAHAQYISVSRPGPTSLPDSPSTSAMMKRLLAKPAPISPAHGFGSGASGSESEGGRMGRVGANSANASMNTRSRSKMRLRSDSPRGGVRSEEEVDERRGGMPYVDFDMGQETLNQDIAMLGQWMARQDASGSLERVSPASSLPDLKEKEKPEKRVRNVLRRKPSASNAKATSSPGRTSSASSPSHPTPKLSSASFSASTAPRQSQLPPIGSFSPLSISPLGIAQETFAKENTAFIHPHEHAQHKPHRAASATAALPTAARASRAPGGVQGHGQQVPSSSPYQQQQQQLGRSTSLYPPSQHLHIPSSTRSGASSQPSSRGSSPRRSPVVSELLSASASTSASARPGPNNCHVPAPAAHPHPQSASSSPQPPPSPLSPTSPTSGKRTTPSGKTTPAASLVEAYKKQEREREARRLAAEKERQERKEERDMALGPSRKMVAEARVLGGPAGRRHSVSELDAERMKLQMDTANTQGGLAVPERALGGLAAGGGSTLTVDSYATTSSGPRLSGDESDAVAGARSGLGFKAIEKLASSVMASTGSLHPSEALRKEIRIRATTRSEDGEGGDGQDEEEEVDVTPYYTVFGSSATRVAAAHHPAEESWAVAAYDQGYWESDVLGRRPVGEAAKEKDKDGRKPSLGRSLSRKVSGRWKKQGGAVVGTLIEEDRQGRGVLRGRASMQERRKVGGSSTSRQNETEREADARTKMRNRRSLRLSIDKFSDLLDRDEPPAVPPLAFSKASRGAGVPVGTGLGKTKAKEVDLDSDCDTECEREDGKKLVKGKKDKEKDKATASPSGSTGPSASGGNRFWKLMRRISVGGLKEKYRDPSLSPPPPVPALPKDFYSTMPALHASRSNDSSFQPNSISTDWKKNKSVSSSPTTATPPKRPPHAAPGAQTTKSLPMPTSTQPRPSITTRSSSPISSSDVASSKFFHRTHSAPSSASSIDDEHPPPLPKSVAGLNPRFLQHIVPPNELGKAHGMDGGEDDATGSITPSGRTRAASVATQRKLRPDEDWQIVRSPSDELPSLPLPPRRLTSTSASAGGTATGPNTNDAASDNTDRSESPTIPSFSTDAAVNAFPSRRLSATLSARSRPSPSSPNATSPTSILPSPISVVSSAQPATSLPPPPRPLRSAQRPTPAIVRPPIIEEPPITPPSAAAFESTSIPQGRKSESHIGRVSPQPTLTTRNRRSSGGMSGMSTSTAATARALRRRSSSCGGGTTASSVRSLSVSVTTPPAGTTTFTFREMDDADRPRQALTEHEKAARWEDLLERSARAGGTLHLAGGARVLASDRLKFSKW